MHKYLYANGDPVNGVDPEGREALVDYVFNLSAQALKAIMPITEMVGTFVELQVVPMIDAAFDTAAVLGRAFAIYAQDAWESKTATALMKLYVCADFTFEFAVINNDIANAHVPEHVKDAYKEAAAALAFGACEKFL